MRMNKQRSASGPDVNLSTCIRAVLSGSRLTSPFNIQQSVLAAASPRPADSCFACPHNKSLAASCRRLLKLRLPHQLTMSHL